MGITDQDVAAYRAEKARAKGQGKRTMEAPKAEPESPVTVANRALAALEASGLTGAALDAAKRAILGQIVKDSTGIQTLNFPKDGGAPPGFRALDVRLFIPTEPSPNKAGRQVFLNDAVKLAHGGRAYTLQVGLFEYAPEAGISDSERAKRLEKAVKEAMATIPA